MSERQIDDAIDEAVRDLMNVDADPAFRARVADRLRKPAPRPFVWRQAIVAAAAVAVLAGVFSIVREMKSSQPQPADTSSSAAPAPAAVSAPPLAAGGTESGRSAAPARIAAARPSGRGPTQAIPRGGIVATVAEEAGDAAADPETAVAGAAPSEPLSIAAIEMRSIAPAPIRQSEIVVAPLTPMTELVVAPLDLRCQRE